MLFYILGGGVYLIGALGIYFYPALKGKGANEDWAVGAFIWPLLIVAGLIYGAGYSVFYAPFKGLAYLQNRLATKVIESKEKKRLAELNKHSIIDVEVIEPKEPNYREMNCKECGQLVK